MFFQFLAPSVVFCCCSASASCLTRSVILKKYPFYQELFLCKTFKLTALYDPPGGLGYHRTQTVACPNTRIL